MSIDLSPYRKTIRKYIANAMDSELPDYETDDPNDGTLPDRLEKRRDLVQNIKKPVVQAAGLISAVQGGNPSAFVSQMGKSFLIDYMNKQKKSAELYEYPEEKVASSGDTKKTKKLAEFINSSPPVPLLITALKRLFGDECFGWEPETIFNELSEECVDVTDALRDKVNCALLLYLQPDFLNEVITFENCVRAMNDLPVQWDIFQKPDIPYICWGVAQGLMAMELSPFKPPGDSQFSDEVETYISMALLHDNYINAPDPLVFAQDTLDKFSKNHNAIRPFLKKRWKEVEEQLKAGDELDLDDSELLDIQVGRLVGCWLYMRDKMAELGSLQDSLNSI
jgi:hypothetical protein